MNVNSVDYDPETNLFIRKNNVRYLCRDMGKPSVHVQANTEVLEIVEDEKGVSVTVRALPDWGNHALTLTIALFCVRVWTMKPYFIPR